MNFLIVIHKVSYLILLTEITKVVDLKNDCSMPYENLYFDSNKTVYMPICKECHK